jgi:hypothetical protein
MNIDGNILQEFNEFIQKSAMMLPPQMGTPLPGQAQPAAPPPSSGSGDNSTHVAFNTPVSGQTAPRTTVMPAVNNSTSGNISNTNTEAPTGAPEKAKPIKKM